MKKNINKLEQIKQRIKTAAIISGVALSSLGMPQNAAAQTSQDKSSTEIKNNKYNVDEKKLDLDNNLHKYFYADGGDNGIYIEAKDLAKCLKSVGISAKSPESQKFITSYLNNVDDNGKITFWNFNKVISETLQPEQANAFCNALYEVFNEKEVTQNKVDIKTLKNENADIQYLIGDSRISIKGNVSIDISTLLPPIYILKNNQYKCGTTTSSSMSVARNMEASKLRKVVIEHYVYKDLCNSAETSNPVVKDFMERHKLDMKKHGLSVDSKGNFVQQANLRAAQNTKSQIR